MKMVSNEVLLKDWEDNFESIIENLVELFKDRHNLTDEEYKELCEWTESK